MSKITLLQKYEKPIFIASQSEGQVYKISDKYVVKVPCSERYKEDMFHEIKIARLLYSLGFPVPEPITIDYVNVRDNKVELGYIMEYIDGISIFNEDISKEDKIVAHNLLHRETKKLFRKGFTSMVHAVECIFTKEGDIKLIDFSQFQYKEL